MLLIRALIIFALVCLHVLGGAALFRRYFPRESPWWGFFLPGLALVCLLNFLEHFIPLTHLGWLLPITTGGLAWALTTTPAPLVRKLILPGSLFVGTFAFTLAIKCMGPDVNFYCTEGLTDLNRILDFCLGDTLPPTDSWLPPYNHAGYYTFMHYGASIIKRLFSVEVGTAYNVGQAFVSAFTLLACAAAAFNLGRFRWWIALLALLMLAGGFTGGSILRMAMHPWDFNVGSGMDVSGGWEPPSHNEFGFLLAWSPPDTAFRFYTPGCFVYYSEFHATMAGHFLAILTVFAVAEVLRRKHTIFPWIVLLAVPVITVISCPWFFIIVTVLAYPTLILAWATGRRPTSLPHVVWGAAATLALIWPTFSDFTRGAISQRLIWHWDFSKDAVTMMLQYWPIYLPWFALIFVWLRLTLAGRWLVIMMVPLFFFTDFTFFTERGTTLEKTLGGFYGVGLTAIFPLLFARKGWLFRLFSIFIVFCGIMGLSSWTYGAWRGIDSEGSFMHLEGNYFQQRRPQLNRMNEVVSRVRLQTMLNGKVPVAFFENAAIATFTDNRSFIGWVNAKESSGHPEEAHARQKAANSFYEGTMSNPLHFLNANGITVVLVWPNDKMSQSWLDDMKWQLDPEFTYVDCKGEGENLENAGVFLKRTLPVK